MLRLLKTILRTNSTHEIVPKGKEMGSDADIMTQAVITMVNKCLICSLHFIFFCFCFQAYIYVTHYSAENFRLLTQTSSRQELRDFSMEQVL